MTGTTDPLTAEELANYPIRVVVDQHGHYWRDYGDHWSMCPVSDENVATDPVYEFYPLATLDAAREGQGLDRLLRVEAAARELRLAVAVLLDRLDYVNGSDAREVVQAVLTANTELAALHSTNADPQESHDQDH